MPRREAQLVWPLFAFVSVEILVTYSRVPVHELYHVSGGGLALGAGRALVFANYPTALVALAVLGLVWERLDGRLRPVAVAAAVLCAAVFWPGVVSQANLDAKHRDRLAFLRVCSGRFERDMSVIHTRTGKKVRLSSSHKLFGRERETVDEA